MPVFKPVNAAIDSAMHFACFRLQAREYSRCLRVTYPCSQKLNITAHLPVACLVLHLLFFLQATQSKDLVSRLVCKASGISLALAKWCILARRSWLLCYHNTAGSVAIQDALNPSTLLLVSDIYTTVLTTDFCYCQALRWVFPHWNYFMLLIWKKNPAGSLWSADVPAFCWNSLNVGFSFQSLFFCT